MNPHDRFGSADFKSAVSADFTIRAGIESRPLPSLSYFIGIDSAEIGTGQEPEWNSLRINE